MAHLTFPINLGDRVAVEVRLKRLPSCRSHCRCTVQARRKLVTLSVRRDLPDPIAKVGDVDIPRESTVTPRRAVARNDVR